MVGLPVTSPIEQSEGGVRVQITISIRHGDLNPETQEKIKAKLTKLPRFFERLTAVGVTVDLEHKETKKVEVCVSVEQTHDFVATEVASNVMAAIDGTMRKLEQQLRRHKEKLKGHKAIGLKHQMPSVESVDGGVEELEDE